jgi:hypothetical protein
VELSEVVVVSVGTYDIGGTSLTLGVPDGWRTSVEPHLGLLSVEPVEGRFAATFTALLEPGRREMVENPAAAATAMLLAPVLLDLRLTDTSADVLVCHLAGPISVTAIQRQVIVAEGLLALTFTAATSRWGELCGLADEVLDSIGAAA